MANVTIVSRKIRPGGGPFGYTHNLAVGVDQALQNQHQYHFTGDRIHRRTASAKGARTLLLDAQILRRIKARITFQFSEKSRETQLQVCQSDVAIFQGYQDWQMLRAARKAGVQTVYMPHSPVPFALEKQAGAASAAEVKFHLDSEKRLFALADYIVFPSYNATDAYRATFQNLLDPAKITYILSGIVPPAPTVSRKTKEAGRIQIFYAGRYVEHKGYDLFVDLARRNTDPAVEFHSVGQGALRDDTAPITDHGWCENIHDLLMKEADLVIIPNKQAFFDLLPLECAFLGLPMVLSEVGGNIDQLALLPDALGFGLNTPVENLIQATQKAVATLNTTPNWGQANIQAAHTEFLCTTMAEKWDRFVSSIIARHMEFV